MSRSRSRRGFRYRKSRFASARRFRAGVVTLLVLVITAICASYVWLTANISAPDSTDTTGQVVTIETGSSDAAISELLHSKGLIKSPLAYYIYTVINGHRGQAQAGSYEFSPSMAISEIVNKLINGEVSVDLITILPAQRINQLREYFIEKGYFEKEVDEALNPDVYNNNPLIAETPQILTLEGYLSPESFQYTSQTPLRAIVEQSLSLTNSYFTADVIQKLAAQGLSKRDAIIIASIVENEVTAPEDKAKVAQVFLKRLKLGISLGADPTAHYGASLIGLEESVLVDTAYNTRIYAGLPPGPISNISRSSLEAVASPAATDFLFFVAGDDGVTHFSNTIQEHEALTAQYCTVLCR